MELVLRVEAATCRCVVMERRVEHKMCHSFSKNSGALPAEQTHLTLSFCPDGREIVSINTITWMQ